MPGSAVPARKVLFAAALAACAAVTAFAQAPSAYQVGDAGASLEEVMIRLERAEAALQAIQAQQFQPSYIIPQPQAEGGFADGAVPVSADAILAEDKTIQDRLKSLEKAQKKADDAAAKKKADDAAKPTFKFNGRVHADYWAFPHTSPGANAFETGNAMDSVDDRFLFRRIRMEISGTMPDNMVYRMQVDFNVPNEPQIKDVYLGWEELPVLRTLLIGNQKRPYGLDHINSSRYNVFMERPAVVEAFNQDARRFGMCSYGYSEDEAYNWRYGAYMSQDMQGLGIAQATPIAEAYQAEFAGRFANTIWYDEASEGRGFAHWAVAGTVAGTDGNAGAFSTARFRTRPEARTSGRWEDTGVILNATSYQLFALEGLLNTGPVQWVTEYQHVSMQRSVGPDLSFGGAYVYASYFLTGESMTWDRTSGQLGRVKPFENFFLVRTCDDGVGGGWGAWQIAARYDYLDLTDDNVEGGILDALTFGLNWHWSPYSKVQFNYILGEIREHRPVDGQTAGNYQIFGTRFYCEF